MARICTRDEPDIAGRPPLLEEDGRHEMRHTTGRPDRLGHGGLG